MPKPLNCNEDLVRDLLNHSKFGAMGQVFVMEAIQAYAAMVIEGKVTGPMPGPQWGAVAQDVKARCDAFYSRHDRPAQEQQAAHQAHTA